MDAEDISPVRSNVNPDQPLRPKPPSDGVFKVTPQPNHYSHGKFGVQNPNYYSESLSGPTTENYGPNDFIVETVKLDKQFFNQFFTSKPLLLGTDVVTSTSVKVHKEPYPRKRSRKTNAELPDSLIDFSQQKYPKMPSNTLLHQMAINHYNKADTKLPTLSSIHKSTKSPTTINTTSTTTTTTTTPKTTTRTTLSTTSMTSKISDVPNIINSVKTFKRYYIPPEVKISHTVNTE